MIVILIILVLILLFWIYRKNNAGSEKFTIIRSDPQNSRLESEAYSVFEDNEPEQLDMNERMMKKNQALGRLNADASRGAQKNRVDYFRHIFQDEFERNEEKDWWESPSSFSSAKKKDDDWQD